MSELPINQVVCGAFPAATRGWPDGKINLVMFSPPYWGLRNYGENVNAVWGGDPSCEHEWTGQKMTLVHENRNFSKGTQEEVHGEKGTTYIKKYDDKKAGFCSKCGAWFGQLGLEPTYQMYVAHLVEVGREIRRILRKDGSWYLNLGDTYATHTSKRSGQFGKDIKEGFDDVYRQNRPKQDVPEKCKLLIPHRVALALIDDGWICRNDITWYKPNAMPSSAKDRLTCQTECVFHFVKSRKYFYDLDAIREPHKSSSLKREGKSGVVPFNLRVRDVTRGKFGTTAQEGKLRASKEEVESYLYPEKLTKHDVAVDRVGNFSYTDPLHTKEYHPAGKNPGDVSVIPESWGVDKHGGYHGQAKKDYESARAQNPSDTKRRIIESQLKHPGRGKNPGDVLTSRQENIVGHFREKGSGGHYEYGGLESPEGVHYAEGGRNPGDFWGITTKPSNDYWCPSCKDFVKQKKMKCVRCGVKVMAHFAVYPEELCIKPIKSSCPSQVCRKCGRPRERITKPIFTSHVAKSETRYGPKSSAGRLALLRQAARTEGFEYKNERETISWTDCGCGAGFEPGIVVDPMCGRGTTLVVAKKLGLRFIGIDINPDYCEMTTKWLSSVEWPLEAYA